VSIIFLPKLSNIANRIGLVDYPNERKVHGEPKPLIGGIGIMIAFSLSSLMFIPFLNLRGFYSGMTLLIVIGFLDDFREIKYTWKFISQLCASIFMMLYSKTILYTFGNLFGLGSVDLGSFALPLTVFCILGVINAVNMIDGMDGLAGGVSLIAFVSFATLAYMNGQPELMLISIALSGAVLGFLKYNWTPSSLFMGDAGSFSLGFSLAFLSIAITQKENSIVPPMSALLILAVPIVDTVTIMIKRIINRKNPFHADKYHLHHILQRFGLGRKAAVIVILCLSLLLSSIGVLGTILSIPDYYLFLVFSIYFIMYLTTSFFIKEMLRLNGRLMIKLNGRSSASVALKKKNT
jgi:UDP-GlcNAc:undecaprenyl-phosphate GlcNAc-1-phosphate transferase